MSLWQVIYRMILKPGRSLNRKTRNFLIYNTIRKNQKGFMERIMGTSNFLKSLLCFKPKSTEFFRLKSEQNPKLMNED